MPWVSPSPQFAPTADKADNLRVIDELSGVAAARGAAVVLFPEYASYFVDPFDATLAANAEDLDGAFVAGLTEIAAHRGVVVVAGARRTRRGRPRAKHGGCRGRCGSAGRLAQASPLRRIRTARVRLGRTGTGQRSRDLRRGRSDDGAHDLLRPALSGGGARARRRGRPRDPGGCGMGQGTAEGAALADASARARH